MFLFGGGDDPLDKKPASAGEDAAVTLKEELSGLVAAGERKDVDRALTEARKAVTDANRADIRELKLIEHGRCPECNGKVENLLYTAVCNNCGWFRRRVPANGSCRVHLDTGDVIVCDRVYNVRGDQFLCVVGGVVVSQVMKPFIRRVEYVWSEAELAEARENSRREREGVCAWCGKGLAEVPAADGPIEEYAAFGMYQQLFLFCSKKCLKAFRRQYPMRIHRNCYEKECSECNQCIKRYDVTEFTRERLLT